MKIKMIFLIATAAIFVSCGNQNTPDTGLFSYTDTLAVSDKSDNSNTINSDYLLGNGKAGTYAIGEKLKYPDASSKMSMTEETIVASYEDGPSSEKVNILWENSEKLLQIKTEGMDEIGEIMVLSEKYKIKEGISVGSGMDLFMEIFKDYSIWYTYVSGMYVIDTKKYDHLQFLLDEKDLKAKIEVKGEVTPLKAENFKKGAKIIKIRVF